jgi:hypothetical protein
LASRRKGEEAEEKKKKRKKREKIHEYKHENGKKKKS